MPSKPDELQRLIGYVFMSQRTLQSAQDPISLSILTRDYPQGDWHIFNHNTLSITVSDKDIFRKHRRYVSLIDLDPRLQFTPIKPQWQRLFHHQDGRVTISESYDPNLITQVLWRH